VTSPQKGKNWTILQAYYDVNSWLPKTKDLQDIVISEIKNHHK
jgi:hypothetical protein